MLAADSTSGDEEIRPQQVPSKVVRTRETSTAPTPCSSSPSSPSPDDAARCSASLPSTSRWPNSVLGNRTPLCNTADPIPVPKVNKITTPEVSLPAPNESSAIPAASASLRTVTSRPPSALPNRGGRRRCRSRTWSMFAALRRDAPGHDSGQGDADRTGSTWPARRFSATVPAIASGVDGCGVRILMRSPIISPVLRSNRAALDAAAADVDPETCGCHRPALLSVEFEVTIYRCKH